MVVTVVMIAGSDGGNGDDVGSMILLHSCLPKGRLLLAGGK